MSLPDFTKLLGKFTKGPFKGLLFRIINKTDTKTMIKIVQYDKEFYLNNSEMTEYSPVWKEE